MFSNIIDGIRTHWKRSNTEPNIYERRQSVVEQQQQQDDSLTPVTTDESVAHAIPIRRRKTTGALFGISPDSTDDYVQKDLISSSWS
ncbi:hypothetical protein LRAMOSA11055 [Lichtheimia ramosa]|uniref:Uncharacterized protein n=1 Tax=Lichtheimia ramosa TaxID=688394 RepID=A0A077WTH1_9FUNG|nr:hypothetical protein LRAMOSA11055 [Lichtheimia ramosa]